MVGNDDGEFDAKAPALRQPGARHSVAIRLDQNGFGSIEVDGHRVRGVRGVNLTTHVRGRTQIELDLVVGPVEYFGEADIHITPGARETLLRFGWTPPEAKP